MTKRVSIVRSKNPHLTIRRNLSGWQSLLSLMGDMLGDGGSVVQERQARTVATMARAQNTWERTKTEQLRQQKMQNDVVLGDIKIERAKIELERARLRLQEETREAIYNDPDSYRKGGI